MHGSIGSECVAALRIRFTALPHQSEGFGVVVGVAGHRVIAVAINSLAFGVVGLCST